MSEPRYGERHSAHIHTITRADIRQTLEELRRDLRELDRKRRLTRAVIRVLAALEGASDGKGDA